MFMGHGEKSKHGSGEQERNMSLTRAYGNPGLSSGQRCQILIHFYLVFHSHKILCNSTIRIWTTAFVLSFFQTSSLHPFSIHPYK